MRRIVCLVLMLWVTVSVYAVVNVTKNTVIDTDKGFEWQLENPGLMRWRDGMNYCQRLNLNNHTDWRLPNKQELESGAGIAVHFVDLKPVFFWTSTDYEANKEKSWLVNLVYGFVGYDDGGFSYDVKCVRTLKQ
jgi:hypothetical protein